MVVMQVRSLHAAVCVLLTADQSIHSLSGVGIHCFMLSCCTFEDVEIVNVVGPRPKLVQTMRRRRRNKNAQRRDILRAQLRA